MLSRRLNPVEQFLLNLENSEKRIFEHCPENLLLPIIPFFQLVEVINLIEVLGVVGEYEATSKGVFVRVDGYLTLSVADQDFNLEGVRLFCKRLCDSMRY